MHNTINSVKSAPGRGGFTLAELLVAISASLIVMAGMMAAFIWTLKAVRECHQYAWAQTEAIQSSQRLVSYLRNAVAVTNLDIGGNWVEVSMPPPGSGTVARLEYVNPSGVAGAGELRFISNIGNPLGPTNVVAYGVTKVMTMPVRNVFEPTGPDSLRIAYRITKPSESGQYPAEVDIGVRMRNH